MECHGRHWMQMRCDGNALVHVCGGSTLETFINPAEHGLQERKKKFGVNFTKSWGMRLDVRQTVDDNISVKISERSLWWRNVNGKLKSDLQISRSVLQSSAVSRFVNTYVFKVRVFDLRCGSWQQSRRRRKVLREAVSARNIPFNV